MTLNNYWWLLIWILIGGGILSIFPKQKELVCDKNEIRWNGACAFALILPYIIWCAFRTDVVAGDTAAYRKAFNNAPDTLQAIGQYMSEVTKDKGFYFMTACIRTLTTNSVVFFLIIAAFQLSVLAWLYRKYSCNYWFSIFLFIASTDYMSWAQNGIRQFMAITICLLATPFVLKKKILPTVILVLLAATMHQSALLMLPIFIIALGKPWNLKTIILLIGIIIAVAYVDQFTNILDTAMQETQYANMVTDWTEWNDDGTNPIRVLVYSIPALMSLFGLRYVKFEQNRVIDFCVNMSIITSGLYILSMMTSGIFIGRLPAYASFYNYILLPWLIENIFSKKSARIIEVAVGIAYCIFFYYQMHFGWAML